jgi:hypothetical protein
MKKSRKIILFGILAVIVAVAITLTLPSVWSRVSFRVQQTFGEIKYALFPPEKSIFTPGQQVDPLVATAVQGTLNALSTTQTATPTALSTALPTPLPTNTPVPLPPYVYLEGVRPEQQRYNNCGPTTLSMYLSFYKWDGHLVENGEVPQDQIAPFLKPYKDDKNVMPYEMKAFVEEYTDLRAILRMGGDLQTIKTLLSAGFPVMVEKGFEDPDVKGWSGHYNLVIGYDEARQVFFTQDSYKLIHTENWRTSKGFEVPYADMLTNWRAFNYIFLVIYPQDKGNDVLNALGPLADETAAYQVAYDRAVQETASLTDARDLFFAWFNMGTSKVYLQEYATASAAYDSAYSIYPSIPESARPWRMIWYQTGPYFAYFYSGRYQDVINLADTTLTVMAKPPAHEESYYWRARAKLALGDQAGAIQDLQESLVYHAGFIPSVEELQTLGINP